MPTVYVSVSSNINPLKNVADALEMIQERVGAPEIGPFYWTEAIARPEQPHYLNGVIRLATDIQPEGLKRDYFRAIEKALGRTRSADRYAAREIDVDLLLYGDEVVHSLALTLPDPDVLERPFLYGGILALAPDIRWPENKRPLREQVDLNALDGLQADHELTQQLKARLQR